MKSLWAHKVQSCANAIAGNANLAMEGDDFRSRSLVNGIILTSGNFLTHIHIIKFARKFAKIMQTSIFAVIVPR